MSPIDVAVIATYVAGCTALGAWLGSKSQGLKGYFLGESNTPAWAVMISIVATETSTATFLSVPGVAYRSDFTYLQLAFGYLLGRVVVATVLLPAYFRGEIFTAYQLLKDRFGGPTRTTASVLFLVARSLGDGLRLFLAAKVLQHLTTWPIGSAIVAVAVITVIYTFLGGIRAVIWTDVIQFSVYIIGALVALLILVNKLPGGWPALVDTAGGAGKFRLFDFSFDLTKDFTFWSGLVGGLVLNTATHGADQMMVQRYLAARSQRQAAVALVASGFVILAQFALFLFIGVSLWVFYKATGTADRLASSDDAFAYFIVHYLPTGVLGLVIAAIFSAAMGTLAGSLNASASTIVNDLYRPLTGRSNERHLLLVSRLMTAAWGLVLTVVAFYATGLQENVVVNALKIASFVSGLLLGLFLLGILTSRVGQSAALVGLIAGFAAVSFAKFGTPLAWPWYCARGLVDGLRRGAARQLRRSPEPRAGLDRFAGRPPFLNEANPDRRAIMRPWTFAIAALCLSPLPCRAGLPESVPERVGMDPTRLARLDEVIEGAIASKAVPGAVVLVGRRGQAVYFKAFGRRAVTPDSEPMTRDSVFDMASLTKPVATATSVLILVEQAKLRLNDRLGRLLPEFDNHAKGLITVEQLLRHRAGFIADNPIADFSEGPEAAWKRLAGIGLINPPGASYVYSDVGFMALGRVVERVSGRTLDRFADEMIFHPLGMQDTHFRPEAPERPPTAPESRVVPTEPDGPGGTMLRGRVHDPRARKLGGVAGHAGLFSTASDLAVYAQTLLDGGLGPNGRRVLGPLTVRAMTDPGDTPERERRGLGWDVDTPHSAPRGELFGRDGFGHTGFTGTSLWIDRATETFVIVLTSRLHPDGKAPSPTALRSRVATIVASAIVDATPPITPASVSPTRPDATDSTALHPVACGIDVLAANGFEPLKGRRVGLVTNHTGRTREGVSTIDVLFKAPGVTLVALFSPEHGIRGLVDSAVSDGRDEATGLPVYSLYGQTRKPTAESLKGVDLLVYDIQDIGARFYTYISTLGLVLEAAKEHGIPVVVLDRPNPIGGDAVAGPVRDPGFESFIAYHPLPVRHGMTVGELARLFNAERKIGADLSVVACEGWRRGDFYDRSGLLWVNPSPNMRSPTEALLYPGVGLLEASNLATGRGTDTPFERLGAPWIDPRKFSEVLNALALPGVRAVPTRFTPKERQYAGKECGGVYLMVTDRARFEPVSLGIGLATVLRKLYPDEWEPAGFLKMLADDAGYRAVLAGKSPREVEAVWQAELEMFRRVRQSYLLYR